MGLFTEVADKKIIIAMEKVNSDKRQYVKIHFRDGSGFDEIYQCDIFKDEYDYLFELYERDGSLKARRHYPRDVVLSIESSDSFVGRN